MATTHTVQQGECFSTIAARYGFADYQKIYSHPENDSLRRMRPDPNLLHPGDLIVIPEHTKKKISLSTGTTHTIVVQMPKKRLRIRLKDADGRNASGAKYVIGANKLRKEGTTTEDGMIDLDIPAEATVATIEIDGSTYPLRLGQLNPLVSVPDDGTSGIQARLTNLGYEVGEIDGKLGPHTKRAVRAFQEDTALAATGIVDDTLLEALKKAHGC